MPLPQPSAFELKGRQSVRATFKLSRNAIDALSIVAAHLGIKQKSVFDHLIEDARSLMLIAKEIDSVSLEDLERVQKTYVISRNALISLEKTANKFNAPRDALVELSIQRLLPIISREQKKHEMRKIILNEIESILEESIKLLAKLETNLGDDDPTTVIFGRAVKALAVAQNEISGFVDKGEMIEAFDFSHLTVDVRQHDGSPEKN